MAQTISLLGATYSDVPAVELPKSGGGTATFTDVTDTTAAAADVASGKYFYTSAGVKTAGTASGGGGAQVAVHGTFKYDAEGWYTISLPYTGNGWPVAVIVSPKGGRTNNAIMSAVRRYALVDLMLLLFDYTTQPQFNGDDCRFSYASKSSTSDASSIGASTGSTSMYTATTSTSNSVNNSFRVSGNKEIKVRMVDTTHNTSRYGFLVDIDYEYIVIYSS